MLCLIGKERSNIIYCENAMADADACTIKYNNKLRHRTCLQLYVACLH